MMASKWQCRSWLCLLAVIWWLAEWALALPPILHDGFGQWHRAAFMRLRHDTAFQLVVLDYLLTYAIAFVLSVRQARRDNPERWPWWTLAFLLATAPAMLFFWAWHTKLLPRQVK
jgi:amino acid transporter